jgi:predicted enzyme related to lactoylglutathione lyase
MNKNLELKVGMLILMESDLEAAVQFYKKLGFQLKFHLKEKWAEFNLGTIRFGLCPTSQPAFERHTGIVLEVNDLISFEQKIKAEGLEFFKEPVVAVHGIMTNIKDPSGNILDIYQPTPEKVKEMAQKVSEENK